MMVERYTGDGAVVNGFGRLHLHEDEARHLYEAEYRAPLDMRASGSWRLSVSGVPVPPQATGAEGRAGIARIRSGLPEDSCNLSRYTPDNKAL
ncbi:Homeobox protein KNOX3 [Hordeum vulgare]|nr:Homeobox protein KNOX3 [Hordeum vulgare]